MAEPIQTGCQHFTSTKQLSILKLNADQMIDTADKVEENIILV